MIGAEQFVEYAGIIVALLLLEAVLSFDNAAILAAMVRRLPVQDRKKALFYGLLGAYVLRITTILLAWWLIKTPWLKLVGGGYLIFLFAKHMIDLIRHKRHEEHHEIDFNNNWLTRLGVPMLAATIIQIELVDLAFALDQVLAAVAFVEGLPRPDNLVLIIIASVIGILFLRLAAVFVVRVMDWLPLLEHMAYVAVGFVGIKLTLLHPVFVRAGECVVPGLSHHRTVHGVEETICEIPSAFSVFVTLSLFLVPVLIKLIFDWPKSAAQHDVAPLEQE